MTGYANAEDWMRFLRPVAAAVRNMPSPDDFRGRCGVLAFALRIPPGALTEARQRELCRTAEFWPSIAEIEAIFASAWKDDARSRAIANAGGANMLPAPQREPVPQDQRERMAEQARAIAADLRARSPAQASRPTARHLQPRDLIAAYEAAAAEGNQAAAARLEILRREFQP